MTDEDNANAAAVIAALKSTDPFEGKVNFDPFNIFNQPNRKASTIKYADLGGALLCNSCMKKSATDLDNAAEQKICS